MAKNFADIAPRSTFDKYLYITSFLVYSRIMDIDSTASSLAALGHPARLTLFRLLVRAEPQGLTVTEIGAHLDMPLSTLAHHLRSLKQAGLIAQTRDGREVRNRADVQSLHNVLHFIVSECCEGIDTPTSLQELVP